MQKTQRKAKIEKFAPLISAQFHISLADARSLLEKSIPLSLDNPTQNLSQDKDTLPCSLRIKLP